MRITGVVEKTARADAEAYFETQPRDAQLTAWASWQSSQIADREFLDARVAKLGRKYGGEDKSPRRRVGAATVCGPKRWNSGRAARINCTTGCNIHANRTAAG